MNCYTADILIPTHCFPFFTCVSARVFRCRSVVVMGEGVGIFKFVKDLQINCEVEEGGCCVLCDRDNREYHVWPWCKTWSVSLTCLDIPLTIILAKHDTALDHVMTPPTNWAVCTAVALWICIHRVPADTTDILKFSLFLPLLQINSGFVPRLDEEGFNFFFSYLLSDNRPTLCSWRTS